MLCLLVVLSWGMAEPKVNGDKDFVLHTRKRVTVEGGLRLVSETASWAPARTAVIVCDMWNAHWCAGATRRVAEMAPRANDFVEKARSMGALIIHAPSDTLSFYKDHPGRKRAMAAPKASNLPAFLANWSGKLDGEAGATWPIDQSDGGCDCQPRCKTRKAWSRQIDAIKIHDIDAISDSGVEVWNLLEARDVRHVILLGVHTNMCVIGRPFGLRNMVRAGRNVVLVRDLTDTMYNSRKAPLVNHFTGTDLIIQYIERYVCPTVTSSDLTGRAPFRFKNDKRKRIVFLSAEGEYGACYTLPVFARELALKHGFSCTICQGSTDKRGPHRNAIPGMAQLADADLAVLFARRRALPAGDMARLKAYLKQGKPLIAIRTSSHAFAPREKLAPGLATWPDFDAQVLGAHYTGYPKGAASVMAAPDAAGHPILEGLKGPYTLKETIYRHAPLADTCQVLLTGKCISIEGADKRYQKPAGHVSDQPVAWTNRYGKARIFYSTFGGHREAFKQPWFKRLLLNAVYWALK